jgi:hypothetical protein
MGSGPGDAGESGMQVQPLLPFRRVDIAPFESKLMMVAFEEIAAGAADSALAMGSLVCAVTAEAVSANVAAPASRMRNDDVMKPSSFEKEGPAL